MTLLSGLVPLVLSLLPSAISDSSSGPSYALKTPPLTTDWTAKVGTDPWTQYPRPQMVRKDWQSLNGVWGWRNASGGLAELRSPPTGQTWSDGVLVPSCIESGLSGVQADVGSAITTWWHTTFTVPSGWNGQNVLINFGAVDYEATVFVNGKNASFHRGGYSRFAADITPHLSQNGQNELLVFVHDPTDSDDYVVPIGKQTLNPSHIFYRPCSGIWQSVFLEPVPKAHVDRIDISADMHGVVTVNVTSAAAGQSVTAELHSANSSKTIATGSGQTNQAFNFTLENPSLWAPGSPTLYNVTVKMGSDSVETYTGFRSVGKGVVNGVQRPLVNGKPTFIFGPLDQGFWPDGLYTPPSYDAMTYDIKYLQNLGFNMIRKHIKVETDLYYRACDEMGMLVMQDMPSMRADGNLPNATQQKEFNRQLFELVQLHKSFPSIFTWVIYNEGWGQLPSAPELYLTPEVRALDPTRLIDSVTGWHDHGAGDYSDNHHYSSPQCGTPWYSIASSPHDPSRIGFQGEFGGLGQNVSIDHLWNVEEAINTINQTYELDADEETWNFRAHQVMTELLVQTQKYSCSGGVWTQTTDVEGEVNGFLTYDRRVSRANETQWKSDIQALYDAMAARVSGDQTKNQAILEAQDFSGLGTGHEALFVEGGV